MAEPRTGGLVLYKRRPARVKNINPDSGRLEVEIGGGETQKVRPKDIVLLHPGPVTLSELRAPDLVEDVDSVRDLLTAETEGIDLATLAEWLYGAPTPAAIWAAWQIVDEGLHFSGDPASIQARSTEQVQGEQDRRQRAAAEIASWTAFVERLRSGTCLPDDEPHLRDVEGLAEGRREDSRALKALGRAESVENAHALLLDIGWWNQTRVPYATRAGVPTEAPMVSLGKPPLNGRTDLTHMTAYAIDDEGSRDPDDAVSLDNSGQLWVHVADVACLVAPDSAADMEARARGATLYQPDGTLPMMPTELVPRLGLGLAADGVGPALSFRLDVSPEGSLVAAEVVLSMVRVERLSYEQAELLLATNDSLRLINSLVQRSRTLRLAAGAIELDWPEARIRVDTTGNQPAVDIRLLPPLRSRQLVAECMILAGAGAAWYANDRGIPFPYSVQDAAPAPEDEILPEGLPGAYALRRRQQPARVSGSPAPHRGLGLPAYGRATSPMRRYVDLLVHQQLRAVATGATPTWDETALMERASEAETAARNVRGVERQANRHWTLVWLSQRTWQGKGVLVDTRGRRGLLVCPDIALETWVNVGDGPTAGMTYDVIVRSVDLPRLDLHLELTPHSEAAPEPS
jgi:exoribonuclease II